MLSFHGDYSHYVYHKQHKYYLTLDSSFHVNGETSQYALLNQKIALTRILVKTNISNSRGIHQIGGCRDDGAKEKGCEIINFSRFIYKY